MKVFISWGDRRENIWFDSIVDESAKINLWTIAHVLAYPKVTTNRRVLFLLSDHKRFTV